VGNRCTTSVSTDYGTSDADGQRRLADPLVGGRADGGRSHQHLTVPVDGAHQLTTGRPVTARSGGLAELDGGAEDVEALVADGGLVHADGGDGRIGVDAAGDGPVVGCLAILEEVGGHHLGLVVGPWV
jgi:hypothetical protein